MTIRWKDGKVDRKEWESDESGDWIIIDSVIPLADALDECVAALLKVAKGSGTSGDVAKYRLYKLGVWHDRRSSLSTPTS